MMGRSTYFPLPLLVVPLLIVGSNFDELGILEKFTGPAVAILKFDSTKSNHYDNELMTFLSILHI